MKYEIPPNGTFDTIEQFDIQNFKLTLNQANDLLSSKQYLFVYGFVEYSDVFERSHISRFAYCYKFRSGDAFDIREPVGGPAHWESR